MRLVLIVLSLLAVLVIGVVIGLVWRGAVMVGDRRVFDRLARQLEAERRMTAATHATLHAMRQTVQRIKP